MDALVRGVEKKGKSKVCVNCHVDEVLIEDGKAVGVKLADGRVIKAKEARLADEARLAEETRIAEEKRLAEEARIAEEKRI